MRIAVVGPHFAPDTAPTGEILTRLVTELTDQGHQADVVTSLPWYRSHAIEPEWQGQWRHREAMPWGSITRLHPFPTAKSKLWARALAFGGFTATSTVALTTGIERPDLVLAMSPPLTLGLAGLAAARRWSVPFVFNIQDVFPDVAVEIGAITNRRAIAIFARLERYLYEHADAVTVLSSDLADNVTAKLSKPQQPKPRVVVIPNFVDTSRIRANDDSSTYRRANDLGDATVVMYAGNVGHSQPLGMMIDAAVALRDRDDVVFVINGEGVARQVHEDRARSLGLTNLRFVDYQPPEQLSETLAAGDIHTVLLEPGLARSSVPSKMYSILAAGRPIVAAVDAGTEVDRVITDAGAGIIVAPGNSSEFIAALTDLIDDTKRRATAGVNGRRFVESWPNPGEIAVRYEDLFVSLHT